MKNFNVPLFISAFCVMIIFNSCEREDDEPILNNTISRLYVSFSDFQSNPQQPQVTNMGIFLQADSSDWSAATLFTPHVSGAKGGGSIYFHPSSQRVFQSSINSTTSDSVIYIMSLGLLGQPSNTNRIQNKRLIRINGMVFHPSLDNLYAVDNSTSSVLVFNMPRGRNGSVHTSQRFELNKNRSFWDAAIWKSKLYLSRTGIDGGIEVYDNLVTTRDTLKENVVPSKSFVVRGTSNIQGMSLDTVNNILVLTDFNGSTAEGYSGKVLIFENFDKMLENGNELIPSKVITGNNTGLQRPVDVEIDPRSSGKFLYVADPGSKAIYRFLKSDKGNVKPESKFQYNGLTPVGLSLDARE